MNGRRWKERGMGRKRKKVLIGWEWERRIRKERRKEGHLQMMKLELSEVVAWMNVMKILKRTKKKQEPPHAEIVLL
jgi:hypothetical protein